MRIIKDLIGIPGVIMANVIFKIILVLTEPEMNIECRISGKSPGWQDGIGLTVSVGQSPTGKIRQIAPIVVQGNPFVPNIVSHGIEHNFADPYLCFTIPERESGT